MREFTIAPTEWEILKILWKSPGIALSGICEQLSDHAWSYSTVKTLLKRLVDKEYVSVDKTVGNNFRYTAAISEDECKLAQTKSFLNRVFDGSVSMLFSSLAKESKLTPKEQRELREMIEKMEDGE